MLAHYGAHTFKIVNHIAHDHKYEDYKIIIYKKICFMLTNYDAQQIVICHCIFVMLTNSGGSQNPHVKETLAAKQYFKLLEYQ